MSAPPFRDGDRFDRRYRVEITAALFDVGYLLRRFYSNVPRRTTTAMPK